MSYEEKIIGRRNFLKSSGIALSAGVMASPFASMTARSAKASEGVSELVASPFGPVATQRDLATGLPLLKLPRGFRYSTIGWTGDVLDDGLLTPLDHDAMAVIATNSKGELVLGRNHEIDNDEPTGVEPPQLFNANGGASVYDTVGGNNGQASGGCSLLTYNPRTAKFTSQKSALGGTRDNCAGGPSPFAGGSWITCEEDFAGANTTGGLDHGFCFEVPASGLATGNPITQFGRMEHEAIAVDPRSGAVLITEDNFPTFSGTFLFVPDNVAEVAANGFENATGKFFAFAVKGTPNANLTNPTLGETFDIEMVEVEQGTGPAQSSGAPISPSSLVNDPAFAPFFLPDSTTLSDGVFTRTSSVSSPFVGGFQNGCALFRRPEGAWYNNGTLFFADTFAGPIVANDTDNIFESTAGVIWAYTPSADNPAVGVLECVFVSPDESVGNNPDNITVNPQSGTIFFCEDTPDSGLRIQGVTPEGDAFTFAVNNVTLTPDEVAATTDGQGNARSPEALGVTEPSDFTSAEFAGACFSPDGRTMFVNVQSPGITFAIFGPFARLGFPR
ncbi:MAG: alkaline phosphatase PhoX [Pseudomonadota bacterium]